MDLKQNVCEAVQFEVMRRVFRPIANDVVVDPGENFEECMMQLTDRLEYQVVLMTPPEQRDFFYTLANAAYEWCQAAKAPDDLTARVKKWLEAQVN